MVNKVFLVVVTLSITMFSCNRNIDSDDESDVESIDITKIKTITVDNCEYLIYKEDKDQNSAYGFMAHKGNCSNPVHECY